MNSNFDPNSEELPQAESTNLSGDEISLEENPVASPRENNPNYQQLLGEKEQQIASLQAQVEERTSHTGCTHAFRGLVVRQFRTRFDKVLAVRTIWLP